MHQHRRHRRYKSLTNISLAALAVGSLATCDKEDGTGDETSSSVDGGSASAESSGDGSGDGGSGDGGSGDGGSAASDDGGSDGGGVADAETCAAQTSQSDCEGVAYDTNINGECLWVSTRMATVENEACNMAEAQSLCIYVFGEQAGCSMWPCGEPIPPDEEPERQLAAFAEPSSGGARLLEDDRIQCRGLPDPWVRCSENEITGCSCACEL